MMAGAPILNTLPTSNNPSVQPALGSLEADTSQDASQIPRDARLISLLLQSMGIDEFEPRVLHQLLEFMHRKQSYVYGDLPGHIRFDLVWHMIGYVLDVLNDAMIVSDHAGRQEINVADLELAVLSRLEHSFALPPSHDVRSSCLLRHKRQHQPCCLSASDI